MSQNEELIKDLRSAVADARQAIEASDASAWGRIAESEQWTAAALARHITQGVEPTTASMMAVALGEGGEPELTVEYLYARADRHAAHHGAVSKAEVLVLLAENAAATEERLSALSSAQLSESGIIFDQTMTTVENIQGVVLGHLRGHLQSLQQTAGLAPATS